MKYNVRINIFSFEPHNDSYGKIEFCLKNIIQNTSDVGATFQT